MIIVRPILLFAFLLLCTCTAIAADIPSKGGDVSVRADSISHDQIEDTVIASGNVEANWEGISITADRASYSRASGQLTASGNVVMTRGDDVLRGDTATVDLQSGRSELTNGSGSIGQSDAVVTGSRIVRNPDGTLELSDTDLTTCDTPVPSWKFGASRLNVNLDGYAVGRNLVFYIKDVPVLYLPWMAFPVVRERKTGFLLPYLGYSRTRGARFDIPFYLVIAPNQDLLVDLDIQTKRGVGTGVNYRYARKRGSEGSLDGYLIYDDPQERWRGRVLARHTEIFSPDRNLRVQVNMTSDRTFLKEFGEKNGEYNRQTSDTIVNALNTWEHYALTASLRYTQNYYAPTNEATLQTLPELGLAALRQQFGGLPLYFDLDSSLANFHREAGTTGQRLYAFPRATVAGPLPGGLNGSLHAGAHLLAYNTDNPASGGTERNSTILQPDLGATLSASLSRVYQVERGALSRLRHELVPEISYRYTPERNASREPFYDYTDRPVHRNLIYYGVTSLLGGRFQEGERVEYRELSRLRLLQGYSMDGGRRDLLTTVDDGRPLTDVMLESETWLHPRARLLFDARYNLYDNRLASAFPGLEMDDGSGNSARVSYRMARGTVEYLEAHLSTRFIPSWTLGYTARYSFDRGDFLEAVYSGEYRHQCWSVNFAYRDRPGNQSFTVNFNLAGLTGSR